MPSVVIPDCIQTTLVWQLSGVDHAVNVLHYIVAPAFSVDQDHVDDFATAAGDAFTTAGTTTLDTLTADNFTLHRVTMRDLREANQPEFSATVNEAGLNTSDPLPNNVSLVVTLRTALAGRSFRGRTYIPGGAESQNGADGQAQGTYRTACADFIADLAAPVLDGQEALLGVASRVLEEINLVTAVLVRDNVWDTQRRRAIPGI